MGISFPRQFVGISFLSNDMGMKFRHNDVGISFLCYGVGTVIEKYQFLDLESILSEMLHLADEGLLLGAFLLVIVINGKLIL